jgi:hypothetical protein
LSKQTGLVLEMIGGLLPPRLRPEFYSVRTLSVWGALLAGLSAAGAIFFVTCSAVFFSTVFRKTTLAAVMNVLFVCAIWLGVPFLYGVVIDFRQTSSLLFLIQLLEPMYLVGNIVDGFSKPNMSPLSLSGSAQYAWPSNSASVYGYSRSSKDFGLMGHVVLVGFSTGVYALAGCLLVSWAARRLRASTLTKS